MLKLIFCCPIKLTWQPGMPLLSLFQDWIPETFLPSKNASEKVKLPLYGKESYFHGAIPIYDGIQSNLY